MVHTHVYVRVIENNNNDIILWGFVINEFRRMTLFISPLSFKKYYENSSLFSLLKPTGYVMHHQFNIQQLYALPTLYLCVLYLSENKQRLVPLTA